MNQTLQVDVTSVEPLDEEHSLASIMSFQVTAHNVSATELVSMVARYAAMYVVLSSEDGEKLSLADFALWLLTRPEAQ